jgi:hypothetical protein
VKAGPRKEDNMPEQEDRDKAAEAEELSPPEIAGSAGDDEVEAHSMFTASACPGWLPV